ncbi:flagellar basal-body MS-ring/collar protein FliF [Sinanaerobacter sp. ZZT-01]|uniref:flagellar basal-body MS-ring/collar protein FliF n=1 Tax=Sinanaerobacter sp. ZZT-01 TaxID=3111540 RepID=UPI002D799F00|nr:flagellar basal-body MS-ring/collar protein FliF [Sinanaerobacter sp. ZZT-01]WRR93608.1 flagellar basal-body MS-ring/collar protein FliF [Sinanaerobacter sp. ZZT-01]
MRDKFDKIIEQIKEINSKLSNRNRYIIIGSAVAIFVFAIICTILLNSKPYDTMFTGVNQQEASEIVTALQELDVTAKYDKNGNVSVPKKQVDELRAKLVMEGYPKSGLTYNTFSSNVDMMATDFEKNTYKIYELQDRLASTIRLFDGVSDAVVTIAVGQDQKYVLEKEKVEPSASVVIITKGDTLDSEQVQGIQRLVARSIPDMQPEQVLITDSTGRDLTSMYDLSQTGSSKLKLALERDMENTIQNKVLHNLTLIFDEDSVRVTAKCTMDVDKKIKEIITYLPSTDDQKGIISKEDNDVEIIGEGTASAGVVGTDSNAQVPVYPNITTDGNEIYYKDNKSFDYLVSKVKEQIQSDSGVVSDLTVAVVINTKQLSKTELAEIKRLVATTAGIDTEMADEKVAVFRASVTEDTVPASGLLSTLGKSKVVPIAIGILVFLLIAGLIAFFILRRIKAKKEAEGVALEEGTNENNDIDELIKLDELKQSREQELKGEIREFADKNPEISAQLIKTWLKGGDGNAD